MLISVCICTYQRPALLRRLLEELGKQRTEGSFEFEAIIVDNDAACSARQIIESFQGRVPFRLTYGTEERRSISYARNKTIALARGDFVAFIDDDEFPEPDWLLNLWRALTQFKAAGILGPVKPRFEPGTPLWVIKGGFYDRPEHLTGYVIPWEGCRTGNVLLDRKVIAGEGTVFDPLFGTGGSDVDFFRRKCEQGYKFLWCNEAVVHEVVPPNRWKRSVMMRRALLRGRNSLKHPVGRAKRLAKAIIAIPLYVAALPILILVGHHIFMRYVIKLCDHVGRLLASVGIAPVRERAM